MAFTKSQQKNVLIVLAMVLVLLLVYTYMTWEKPKTAPLTYDRGSVAHSPVRHGLSRASSADPLNVFLERREEKYPGVVRDIFRRENSAPPRSKPTPTVVTLATPTVPMAPVVPEKTPEQIAEDLAREDLSKFRFLGYLTEKDNTLFLSKDGELFMVKSGDRILKSYKIKEANKDYVVLIDTNTRVEVRVELSGGEQASPSPAPQPFVQPQRPQQSSQPQRPQQQPQPQRPAPSQQPQQRSN